MATTGGAPGSAWLRMSILASLCLSNALYTVIRKESVGSEQVPTEEVVFGSEILKLLICLYYVTTSNEETTSGGRGVTKAIWLIQNSSKMIIVAVCYLIMNVLSFLCLNYIGSGEFTVYSRLGILTTATFSKIILNTQFSNTKWRALCLLVIGCVLVASPVFNQTNGGEDSSKETKTTISKAMVGYLMTVVQVVLSGFVTIYFEKVVKSKTEIITVWERNFQLSFWSIGFCILLKLFPSLTGSSAEGLVMPFTNWSFLTVIVMLLGSVNGLLVAATLKYADSIMKVLAQAGAIIIAATLGYLFQGDPMDIFVLLGCLTSILAIMNYTFDESPPIGSFSPPTSPSIISNVSQFLRSRDADDDDDELILDKKGARTSIV
jgi:solute carrier family 35 (UDP-sugar transporter), member A1/2/3